MVVIFDDMLPKLFFFSTVAFWLVVNSDSVQSQPSEVYIDHITVATSDLDNAVKTYSELGFTFKNGRIHSNGLLNKHIKFKDGSSVELMTLKRKASDPISKRYEKFISKGDGAIYLAIKAPFDMVTKYADSLNVSYKVDKSGPFSYITFQEEGMASFYFINYKYAISDPDSLTTHPNKVTGIKAVWIKSSPQFTQLLTSLGALPEGTFSTPDDKENPVYHLNGYDFIIDETISEDSGIMGIRFESTSILSFEWSPPSENHGIWVGFH